MDRLLHRGQYAAIKEKVGEAVVPLPGHKLSLGRFIGIDENFTLGYRWIRRRLFGWAYSIEDCENE